MMTLLEIEGQKVNSKSAPVQIGKIRPDGLRFTTGLLLPICRAILIGIVIDLQGELLKVEGVLQGVRRMGGLHEYDLAFGMKDEEQHVLNGCLRRLSTMPSYDRLKLQEAYNVPVLHPSANSPVIEVLI
ncbi:MAG: hypothetical protein K0R28_106 [Paenibacillus sp.]|jgi:hypothetical protein|nr:hypothetical protein [Paenibacillus sp.]